jgi:hypothetical protein
VPQAIKSPNRVQREFWTRVLRRLLLLGYDEAICIKWEDSAYTHTNSGAYFAARQFGIKVSVTRYQDCCYIWKRPDHLTNQ